MTALLIFAITLFVGVLLSDLAGGSVLSMAVLVLVVGFFGGFKCFEVMRHAWESNDGPLPTKRPTGSAQTSGIASRSR